MKGGLSQRLRSAAGRSRRLDALLRGIRLPFFFTLDSLAFLVPKPRVSATTLIVRLDALGDFALWLHSGAAEVVEAASDGGRRKVVLAANSTWAQFASDLGGFDSVVSIDVPRFMREPPYRLSRLCTLRRLGANRVVQPRSAKVFLQEDEIVRICGASEAIGAEASDRNITPRLERFSRRYYTRLVPVGANFKCHESTLGRAFAAELGTARPTKTDVFAFKADRKPLPVEFGDRFLVVAPGAGWSGRQWPLDDMSFLVQSLHSSHGLKSVVVGSAADAELGRRLKQRLPDIVIDHTGLSSVMGTVQIMAASRLVVANESGPLHLAIWAKAPVVGIVGGGHFGWFAPYPPSLPTPLAAFLYEPMPCFGCDWHCKFPLQREGSVRCVDEISRERVLAACLVMLAHVDNKAVERELEL